MPDEVHAVSASEDGTVILWDIRRKHRRRPWHGSSVEAVAAIPGGRYVFSAGGSGWHIDGILRLWDTENTDKVRDRTGGLGIATLAVSPDGKYALYGENLGYLEVLKGSLFPPKASLYPAGEFLNVYANAAAFLAGSTRALAGYTDGTLIIWDLENFKEIRRFREHACCVSRVAPLPDGTRALVGYYDRTLILYDLEQGKKIRDFELHRGFDNFLRIIQAGSTVDISTVEADKIDLFVAFTGIQAISTVEAAKIGLPDYLIRIIQGTDENWPISGLVALPDGRRALSGSLVGDVRLWDIETGQILHQLDLGKERLSAVALVAGGRRVVLATRVGRSVLLYDLERGEMVASFIGDTPMRCVDVVRDDLFVAGSIDGAVHILRLLT